MEVPEGYDRSAGKLWIYPTNYPVREYQYNIVHQALFKNTMVTLPTGLGKTFIASVVMYNFYRWYPQGKVIFMAPTKPLVAQQIEACYNIMGIPQHDTAEMTGNMAPTERRKAWHNRRVFFLTPQVLTNDLSRGTCPAEMVKCLVIDEAHKAQGNHAYCQVVRELIKYTKNFRILALSATPGSDIKAVQQVLVNLLISHIELRTEDSIDIKQYSHERKVEKIVVPLGDELTGVRNKYLQQAQYGAVEGDFALAMSLYHGLELLQLHGQRSLYNFLDGIVSGEKSYGRTRTELLKNCNFTELMQVLGEKFAPTDVRMSQVPASQRKPFLAGHPKMLKLEEVVLNHFNAVIKDKKTEDMVATRIMIFSQYRDSVTEITDMLKQHRPMVKAMSFIGQSSAGKATKGFTQKEQLKVMKEFREGGYNTLVSTCVGEEGLDIGEVDLIICFDAHKSPIRLVQRMGRTGRKREGRIVMLVTEGKEEQIYNQSQYSKKNIHKAILNGAKSLQFYNGNPRMVPEGWSPTCHKMYITVTQSFKPTKQVSESKADKTKANSATAQRDKKKSDCDGLLSDIEAKELEERIGGITGRKLPRRKPLLSLGETWDQDEPRESTLSLTEWLPWQNRLQPTHSVQHSKKTKDFVELIQFIELQGQQDSKEDNYGNEMKMFLDKDDILKDRETDDNDGKKSDGQTATRNRQSSKQDKRKKVRRSEHLPKFESDKESDSDKSLPAVDFCGKNPNDEDKDILAKMSECEDVIMEEENLRNCEHLANKKIPIDELRKDETEKADMRNEGVVSSVVINKELSAKWRSTELKGNQA
ncbi:hypothetical protein FSP39_019739 [Pinctada imbricata]|uniref:Fanconi anemia group M protein n=1 Tax=Pinctada imbricata TaxID=66713 RepID=A0AA88XW08_PINIB|nr:hypothetical protein FSP39_019739 [Pinctada imbricata]